MLRLFALSDKRILILLFVLSLALKCAYILFTRSYDQPYRYEYDYIARNLITGQGYTFKGHATAYMMPAYTLLLAAVMATTPLYLWYLIIELLQAVLLASVVFLTYHSALHFFDRSTALLSAALVAVYPLFVSIPSQLIVENLSLFLLLLSLSCCLWYLARSDIKNAVVCGVALGALVMTKGRMIIYAVLLLVWLVVQLWQQRKLTWRFWLIPLIVVIMTAPWVIRNYVVFHKLIFFELNFGENLWIGFNPHAGGFSKPLDGGTWDLFYDDELLKQFQAFRHDEAKMDQIFLEHALQFIRSHPEESLHLVLKKALFFWWVEPTNRKMNIAVYYLPWGWVLVTFVLGCLFSFRQWRKHLLLFLFIIATMFVGMMFFVMVRLRIPVEPLFIMYSSYGIVTVYFWIRNAFQKNCRVGRRGSSP